MKLVCAWCQSEGKPAALREVEPFDDPTETHGICLAHRQQLMAEITAAAAPAGVQGAPTTAGGDQDLVEAEHRLTRWFVDGQLLLTAFFWHAAQQEEQLRTRIETAERLVVELRQTASDLQDEIAGLERRNRSSRDLHTQVIASLRQLTTRTSQQVLQPMYDLLIKLEGGSTATQ